MPQLALNPILSFQVRPTAASIFACQQPQRWPRGERGYSQDADRHVKTTARSPIRQIRIRNFFLGPKNHGRKFISKNRVHRNTYTGHLIDSTFHLLASKNKTGLGRDAARETMVMVRKLKDGWDSAARRSDIYIMDMDER